MAYRAYIARERKKEMGFFEVIEFISACVVVVVFFLIAMLLLQLAIKIFVAILGLIVDILGLDL